MVYMKLGLETSISYIDNTYFLRKYFLLLW